MFIGTTLVTPPVTTSHLQGRNIFITWSRSFDSRRYTTAVYSNGSRKHPFSLAILDAAALGMDDLLEPFSSSSRSSNFVNAAEDGSSRSLGLSWN